MNQNIEKLKEKIIPRLVSAKVKPSEYRKFLKNKDNTEKLLKQASKRFIYLIDGEYIDIDDFKIFVDDFKIEFPGGFEEVFRMSIKKQKTDFLEYLLTKNINQSVLEQGLMWSSKEGYLDGVKMLLSKNVNPNTSNDYPVRIASQNGHLDIVRILIENGADYTAMDNFAIKAAMGPYTHPDVVKFLNGISQ